MTQPHAPTEITRALAYGLAVNGVDKTRIAKHLNVDFKTLSKYYSDEIELAVEQAYVIRPSKEDLFLLSFACLVITSSMFSLYFEYTVVAWISIILCDIYLIVLLCLGAWRADQVKGFVVPPCVSYFFPSRRFGIFVIFGLFFSIIVGFSSLYFEYACDINPKLDSWIDSVYFSSVTITTLGYGDHAPGTDYTKKLVMFELCNTMLLLVSILPLLISRISTFTGREDQHLPRERGGAPKAQ